MSKLIRSNAFPGGYASYTPRDAVLAAILANPSLIGWASGEGLTLRSVDQLWDDLVAPGVTYVPVGTLANGARPSLRLGGMPTIDIPAATGRLTGNLTIPASYTIAASVIMDVNNVGCTIVGGPTNAFPRVFLGTQAGGMLNLTHDNSGSAVTHTLGGAIPLGTPFIALGSYNAATKVGRVALNSPTGNTATFIVDQLAPLGVGLGGFGNGFNPMVGSIGDVFFFNSALDDTARAQVVTWLGRRAGVVTT